VRRLLLICCLASAGCATTAPELPWQGLSLDAPLRLRVTTKDASKPEPQRFIFGKQAARRVLVALQRTEQLAGPPPHQPVSSRRYLFEFASGTRRWQLQVDNPEVFPLEHDGQTRYFPAGELLSAMRIGLKAAKPERVAQPHTQPGSLTTLARRLNRFLLAQRQTARSEKSPRVLLIFVRDGQLQPWSGRPAIAGTAGRWLAKGLAHESAEEQFELPASMRVYASYPNFWLRIDRDGAVSLGGATDRTAPRDSDDPERAQPFPAHYDLVIERVGSGKKLYLDLKLRKGRFEYQVHP